jgi:ATP-dependent DNA helicase RecQ
MWNLATGAQCRHRALCAYFGEEQSVAVACGACDVCLGEIARLPEASVVAQKILSCVVKTGQRFGAAHVTDVLRGAKTEKIRQCGHDALSTYGLLGDQGAREIRQWIEQLLGQGHLRLADGPYPTLFLSKEGVEVLRGEREVTLLAPVLPQAARASSAARRKAFSAASTEAGEPAPDERLFERLRELRREIARERGVPPYIVFNDKTLASMAARRPATPEEFRAIKGVGDKKAEDLGPAFLQAIADFTPESPPA